MRQRNRRIILRTKNEKTKLSGIRKFHDKLDLRFGQSIVDPYMRRRFVFDYETLKEYQNLLQWIDRTFDVPTINAQAKMKELWRSSISECEKKKSYETSNITIPYTSEEYRTYEKIKEAYENELGEMSNFQFVYDFLKSNKELKFFNRNIVADFDFITEMKEVYSLYTRISDKYRDRIVEEGGSGLNYDSVLQKYLNKVTKYREATELLKPAYIRNGINELIKRCDSVIDYLNLEDIEDLNNFYKIPEKSSFTLKVKSIEVELVEEDPKSKKRNRP